MIILYHFIGKFQGFLYYFISNFDNILYHFISNLKSNGTFLDSTTSDMIEIASNNPYVLITFTKKMLSAKAESV